MDTKFEQLDYKKQQQVLDKIDKLHGEQYKIEKLVVTATRVNGYTLKIGLPGIANVINPRSINQFLFTIVECQEFGAALVEIAKQAEKHEAFAHWSHYPLMREIHYGKWNDKVPSK